MPVSVNICPACRRNLAWFDWPPKEACWTKGCPKQNQETGRTMPGVDVDESSTGKRGA